MKEAVKMSSWGCPYGDIQEYYQNLPNLRKLFSVNITHKKKKITKNFTYLVFSKFYCLNCEVNKYIEIEH
jgi:hypothetical protein